MATNNKIVIAQEKTASGSIAIKDFDSVLAVAKEIAKTMVVPKEVTSRQELKDIHEKKKKCDSAVEKIDAKKKSALAATATFVCQCNQIKKLFADKSKEYSAVEQSYKEGNGKIYIHTIVCRTKDPSLASKLMAFCKDNAIEAEEK